MQGKRPIAMLLLGPTASGKTPLGRLLESLGLNGRQCVHFDFGENLRRIVQADLPDGIVSQADIAYLRKVLRQGALLEDGDFPIARRILESFQARSGAGKEALIVLNGLPRHQGQARDMADLLDVQTVLYLRCSAETVLERVRLNTGGDRHNRTDDDLEAVRRKLIIFQQDTEPLVDYYREAGAYIAAIDVSGGTTPEQVWDTFSAMVRKTAG